MTFSMMYLTVCERSLICGDLHRGNRLVADHYFAKFHAVKCIVLSLIGSVLEFNVLVRVFISYQHCSLTTLNLLKLIILSVYHQNSVICR